MDRIKNTLTIKICISVFSLFLFLGMLEIGLRAAGYFYVRARTPSRSSADTSKFGHKIREEVAEREKIPDAVLSGRDREKELYTILCVGDSYTFGGQGSYEDAYPYLLERMLNSAGLAKRFIVLNGASCEYNSRQVLVRLPSLIERYDPDALILLTGSSNRFNLALYDLQGGTLMGIIRTFRVYKMLKIIKMNLMNRFFKLRQDDYAKIALTHDSEEVFGSDDFAVVDTRYEKGRRHFDRIAKLDSPSEEYSPYEKAWFYYNTGRPQEALELCRNTLKDDPEATDVLCAMAHICYKMGQFDRAIMLYEQAYYRSPNSEFVLFHIAYFYNQLCKIDGYCDIDTHLRALELDPLELHNYHNLAYRYAYQSEYTAEYIFKFLQKMLRETPDLMENKLFRRYYVFFQNQEKWEQETCVWLEEDLEGITGLCRERGIRLIIQNYPRIFHLANDVLKKVALRHSLPFVDNYSVFENFSISDRDGYFLDDMHCSTAGHRVMAENVFNLLLAEGIVERNEKPGN